jgi:hypothetical protein
MNILAAVTITSLALAPAGLAQGQPTPAACDSTNIEWVLPGHFDDAVARAKRTHRLLLVKGVSFGIDAAGATCATKGKW